jgi:hypothetical protein
MVSRLKAAAEVMEFAQVSGNPVTGVPQAKASSMASSASIYKRGRKSDPTTDRNTIAKPWQIEAYRHVNICGEARYSVTLFAALASRAEIGVSEPNALQRKAVWVKDGPEVDTFAEIVPTVRERTKVIRDYMLHRTIAGECYLIARDRVDTDPGYIEPPVEEDSGGGEIRYKNWDEYIASHGVDALDPEFEIPEDPNTPVWEIVAVTELRKTGETWEVRHDNQSWLALSENDPVIRMWNPDPENRREAWSPIRSLLPTLREIEWLTKHIFTQVRSRLMSAGVWFLPNNLTFPAPPPDAIEGGAEALAMLNEAELFMLSLAESGMHQLDGDEVSFPTISMADPAALEAIDQKRLIQFWSEIDDKAMLLRSDAVRRFALGMDLPPEQVIGSSGIAVTGSAGSAGSVNHWGVWANEEQTIVAHIEPALDDFVGVLTTAVLRAVYPDTLLVIGYDTASLRLRQDRSKEAVELYDRGLLSGEVTLREVGFDPEHDKMNDNEFKRWLLVKIAGGSATPEQVNESLRLLGVVLKVPELTGSEPAPGQPGRNAPKSLDEHPYEGPPRVQHDQTPAPYGALVLSCEGLVLRALERRGNRLLNDGKRGKDRDRVTPPHMAHLSTAINHTVIGQDFDFGLAPTVLGDLPAAKLDQVTRQMGEFCAELYRNGEPYTRDALVAALEGAA